jgi:hypothetical protein
LSGNDLLVMVPVRGRREQCERLLKSFRETSEHADIVFILDPDDEGTYEGLDWGDAMHAVLAPRGTLADKLNQTATQMATAYPALMWTGDDHVFSVPGWDQMMLARLEGMGGHGWVYPATARGSDAPEIWLASSSVTEYLGWFFPPFLSHYCGESVVSELGKRAGLLRFCPDAVAEHKHWSRDRSVERDTTYREAEEAHAQADSAAWQQWRASALPFDVASLRRQFNPDVAWLLSKIA